jgi:hypothetical protein
MRREARRVDSARRRQDKAARRGASHQQVDCALNVDGHRFVGQALALGNEVNRGEVDDRIGIKPGNRGLGCGAVAQIGHARRHARELVRRKAPGSVAQIVEREHIVASLDQLAHGLQADEPIGACDDYFHASPRALGRLS